ncbi:alpha/beta hydrolase, partial [Bosea sp. CER48]|uniref:alpha/beta hydrolase n=1 Tax=Bosea sp. CER48 TaxID=3377035 RepID=UPI0037FCDAA5
TADGERLVAWIVPPRADKPVLLYFHGNAGNLARAGRTGRFRALTEDGTGLFAVSYRGYGGSTGSPSEDGLLQDARAAYGAAADRFGAGRLIGYGESLGTGVALKLAAEVPLRAVILEAPYLSTAAVAQGVYPYVPVWLLMKDRFRSDEVIGRVKVPLLVMHGERDQVIPFAQGRALFELANPPKRFLRFPAGRHEDLPEHGSLAEVRRFLGDVVGGTIAGAESRTVGEPAVKAGSMP